MHIHTYAPQLPFSKLVDKKPYEELAEQDKERYKREMEGYVPTAGYDTKKKKRQ